MISIYSLTDLWNNFFFKEAPVINVGLLRILWGILYLVNIAKLWENRYFYFSDSGIYHSYYWRLAGHYKTTINMFKFLGGTTKTYIDVFFVIFLVASVMMILGLCSNISILVCFLCWTSLNHRNLYIFHSGDGLMRLIGFLLIFSHAGEAISLDNYLTNKNQYLIEASPWAQRLMMIQVSLVYIKSVINKLYYGWNFWYSGKSVFYVLQNRAMLNFNVPRLFKYEALCLIVSWFVLINQVLIGVGLWFKETVWYSISMGLCMHLVLGVFLSLGFFSQIMISSMVLFVDPRDIQWLLESITNKAATLI